MKTTKTLQEALEEGNALAKKLFTSLQFVASKEAFPDYVDYLGAPQWVMWIAHAGGGAKIQELKQAFSKGKRSFSGSEALLPTNLTFNRILDLINRPTSNDSAAFFQALQQVEELFGDDPLTMQLQYAALIHAGLPSNDAEWLATWNNWDPLLAENLRQARTRV